MGMYNEPIKLYELQMQTIIEERENAIFAKVQACFDVDVDKAELIRALSYDRNQYEKGYADGKADAMTELVRCKDCKHWEKGNSKGGNSIEDLQWIGGCKWAKCCRREMDFCSMGERKDNG